MSKTKVDSTGIDLSDNFAFTGTVSGAGGGKIGQVVTTHTNATSFSTTSSTLVDITGLSVAITPSATDSKILVMATVSCTGDNANRFFLGLKRGSTAIANGTQAGSRLSNATTGGETEGGNTLHSVSMSFVDSPSSTSEQTYKVTGCGEGSTTFRINRGASDTDADTVARGSSTITVMEILA